MNTNICAPNRQFKSSHTCFSKKSLKKIAKSYNKNKAVNDADIISLNLSKKKLHKMITKKMSKVCNDEMCWSSQNFVKNIRDNDISKYTFKPQRPLGKYTWLSTIDIAKVMKQYQRKHNDFIFFGPVPIDFDDIYTEIADINLKKLVLNKGITKFGFIFNLDKHYQNGSHWIAMYMELSDNLQEISFFDSNADSAPKEVVVLMDRLKRRAKKDLGINVKKRFNKIRTQFADSECGVYSMDYIIHRLLGDSFRKTTRTIVKDEEMNRRRSFMFR